MLNYLPLELSEVPINLAQSAQLHARQGHGSLNQHVFISLGFKEPPRSIRALIYSIYSLCPGLEMGDLAYCLLMLL